MPAATVSTTRTRRVTRIMMVGLLLAGCGASTAEPPRPSSSATYLPGLAAETYLPVPREDRGLPVVVLVPGGGWQSADPTGLRPLAARLARRGAPAVTITYRTAGEGVQLERSVDDIRCAAAFAAGTTARPGDGPRPVVLLGHSSGAHLAAVAALSRSRRPPSCSGGAAAGDVRIVGLIGLAGPYEIGRYREELGPLVGSSPAADPDAWRAADPIGLAAAAPPGLHVLLLHGTADDLVPGRMSTTLGDALRSAGVDVTVRMVAGADHLSLFTAPVAAGPVRRWLAGL